MELGNALVVVIPADSTLSISSAASLTNFSVGKIALADPKAVPAGVYARGWLEKEQIWPQIQPKVIPTENVRAALAAVESGNVDTGIVFKTDAGISHKIKVAFEVPTNETPKISYPVAMVKDSKQPAAAKKFLDYLATEDAEKVFKHFDFIILK